MQPSDDEIISRVRRGERRHFASLVGRYRDRGFSLALSILRNREDAEEALQDAFVRAYNGLAGFEGASSFGTWFYRILYNTCLTSLGRRKRDRAFDEPDRGVEAEPAAEPDLPGDYSGFELRDLAERVRGVLPRLPGKYSAIITMFYIQELTYGEIAAVTGLPSGTVKTHLFRARLLLQKEVSREINNEKIAV